MHVDYNYTNNSQTSAALEPIRFLVSNNPILFKLLSSLVILKLLECLMNAVRKFPLITDDTGKL